MKWNEMKWNEMKWKEKKRKEIDIYKRIFDFNEVKILNVSFLN
jgi:hypothetical protein